MVSARNGKIVTFYSYKGGTGRSMMLANVAWILACNGKRVLAVDWDLEAPGLHRYFYPFLVDKELTTSDGLIDVVVEYGVEAMSPGDEGAEVRDDWYLPFADVLRYAAALDYPFRDAGTLDFLPAGRQSESYAARVNTFDWHRFYERLGGWRFIEALKTSMRSSYDFILVDSRTGVSDTSGICTVQMPDMLVACFTLNNQGIDGAAAVVRSVLKARPSNPPVVLPVPMRTDPFEQTKLETRMKYARSKFAGMPADLDDEARNAYWIDVDVPYIPFYGYEELLATFGEGLAKRQSLLSPAEALASRLAGTTMKSVAPDSRRRESVLLAYQRRATDNVPDESLDREAEREFAVLGADEQAMAQRWLPRLVTLKEISGAATDAAARVPVEALGDFRGSVQVCALAGLVQVEHDSASGKDFVQFTNAAMVQRWERLRGWLDRDREFLVWRQQLAYPIASYEASAHDATALIGGSLLDTALGWMSRRKNDLNDAERKFIEDSATAREASYARVVEQQNAEHQIAAKFEQKYSLDTRRVRRRATVIAAGAMLIVVAAAVTWFSTRASVGTQQLRALAEQYARLAQASLGQDSGAKALMYADSAIALDSNTSAAYLVRGTVYRSRLDSTAAFAALNRAISLDSTLTDAYAERARLRLELGDSGTALTDLNKAVILDPTDWQVIYERGRLRAGLGDVRSALGDYDRAIRLQPDSAEAYFYRGIARETLGDTKNAASDYQLVVKSAGITSYLGSAADARWKRIVPTPTVDSARVPAPSVTVGLQYSARQDSAVIVAVRDSLRQVRFAPSVRVSASTNVKGEVRYYSSADARTAARVQQIVETVLARQGLFVKLPVTFYPPVSQTRQVSPTVRPRIEVVFPVLSSLGSRQRS